MKPIDVEVKLKPQNQRAQHRNPYGSLQFNEEEDKLRGQTKHGSGLRRKGGSTRLQVFRTGFANRKSTSSRTFSALAGFTFKVPFNLGVK